MNDTRVAEGSVVENGDRSYRVDGAKLAELKTAELPPVGPKATRAKPLPQSEPPADDEEPF